MDKSTLFTVYNKARKAARNGLLDPKTVDKALGLSQAKITTEYKTTLNTCNCKARIYNPKTPCKHMIKLMIEVRGNQYEKAAMSAPLSESNPSQTKPINNPWMESDDGSFLIAEQMNGYYFIHRFYGFENMQNWIKTERHGTMVHPTKVHGSKHGGVTH